MMPTKTPVRLPRSAVGSNPGPLHGLPAGFQQQPVLRVGSLASRTHAEERRVEARHVIDETGPTGRHLAGCIRVRVEELVDIPSVRGHL